MADGVCALTGKQGKFVKAHLYPRSFYPEGEPDEHLAIVSANPADRHKKSWVGIYDAELVTEEGEAILQRIDQKGFDILKPGESVRDLKKRAINTFDTPAQTLAVELDRKLTNDLILFLSSLLWRFHSSNRPEAKAVDIATHADPIKLALLKENADTLKSAEIVIAKNTDTVSNSVITPAKFRIEGGIRAYELIFGGYRAWVKCDKRKLPANMQEYSVRINGPLYIILHDYTKSRSFKNFASAAKKQMAIHGDPWKGKYREKYGY
ncbi:MAG: hypothetical protein JKY78_11810 [Hyphomonas sp.]|nr:hypothetical protein [Hyphomonas sp.]